MKNAPENIVEYFYKYNLNSDEEKHFCVNKYG